MIEAADALPRSAPSPCSWLDSTRGPRGVTHTWCRLTDHLFGPSSVADAPCLSICAYPAQQQRGRCKHMDVFNVILSKDDKGLPRIVCREHANYDAPQRCATCKDYAAG